ncbi:hypothetical protein [Streptomyces sp. NPDC046925]|uniref:hypothetical protein n=1 Tax=Streptomyces sp. NPDC046925 TaxID=3155375 RepID=UPI0034093E8A
MSTQPHRRPLVPSQPQRPEPQARTDGPLDTRAGLLLLAGAGSTYVAFQHPGFGAALLVGVAVVTVLHILLARR